MAKIYNVKIAGLGIVPVVSEATVTSMGIEHVIVTFKHPADEGYSVAMVASEAISNDGGSFVYGAEISVKLLTTLRLINEEAIVDLLDALPKAA